MNSKSQVLAPPAISNGTSANNTQKLPLSQAFFYELLESWSLFCGFSFVWLVCMNERLQRHRSEVPIIIIMRPEVFFNDCILEQEPRTKLTKETH